MRDLLVSIDPTLWSQVSALIFTLVFIGLIVRIFWPSRRAEYEKHSRLPLDTSGEV